MMSRYDAQGIETEFEPGSRGRVPRNLLDIRSAREMSRAESEALLQAQEHLVDSFSLDHRFTAGDICEMHRVWLGHIYSWAGQYRSVNIAKGDFHFAAAGQVPRLMMELERQALVRHTPCRYGNYDVIAGALAVVHAELIYIAAIHAALGSDYIPMMAIFRDVVYRSLQRYGR